MPAAAAVWWQLGEKQGSSEGRGRDMAGEAVARVVEITSGGRVRMAGKTNQKKMSPVSVIHLVPLGGARGQRWLMSACFDEKNRPHAGHSQTLIAF